MTTNAQAAQSYYDQLKPTAVQQAREYVMKHTPAHLQEEMEAIIEADLTDAVIPEGWATVRPSQPIWISCNTPGWTPGMGKAVIVDGELTNAQVDADELGFIYGGNPYQIYDTYDGTTGPKIARSPATAAFASNGYLNGFLLGPADPTIAEVSNGASIAVTDSTGAAQPGSPGAATVANSAVTGVQLGPIV